MGKNIILIGMMGCGKSTVGGLLAERLGRVLVDTDKLIEEREGCAIPKIFADKGESYFRDLELEVSRILARKENLVIACGGGLPLRPDCIGPLKETGTVVWLRRDPAEAYDTLDVSGRPLAQQGKEAFVERFCQRAPVYERWADVVIEDFSSPETTANGVLEGLK